jgi:hypothetical protein
VVPPVRALLFGSPVDALSSDRAAAFEPERWLVDGGPDLSFTMTPVGLVMRLRERG